MSDIDRLENNIYSFYIKVASKSNRIIYIGDKLKWVNVYPSRWPNYAFDLNFEANGGDEVISFLKKEIRKGLAPNTLFIGPHSNSKGLGGILVKHGFTKALTWPGMIAKLDSIKDDLFKPGDLDIQVVKRKADLVSFVRILEQSMFGHGYIEYSLFENLLSDDNIHFYLAKLNGKPISTSLIFLSSGIAGIYLVSTLPANRNCGFGTQITLASLLDAKRFGYQSAGLFATQLGQRVYSNIGFKTCCNFDIYVL